MARNRQRAKERQARRKAEREAREKAGREGGSPDPNAAKPGPARSHGGDPIADDVRDELERESIVAAGADPVTPPPLSESERLRAGAPPEDVGFSAEVMEYEQDLEDEAGEHFDPAEDVPEEDLVAGGKQRREAADHKRRPRFVQFLIAVWAELQRVQWPDRQAMVTLTGVVLGFVLIAGGYLGLLDAVASRVMQAIL